MLTGKLSETGRGAEDDGYAVAGQPCDSSAQSQGSISHLNSSHSDCSEVTDAGLLPPCRSLPPSSLSAL